MMIYCEESNHKGIKEIVDKFKQREDYEGLEKFINHTNPLGQGALSIATKVGNLKVCKILLKYGANVNAVNNVSCFHN